MRKLALALSMGMIVCTGASFADAKGVCSTGEYKTCVSCCGSGIAGVSDPTLCKQQCKGYLPRQTDVKVPTSSVESIKSAVGAALTGKTVEYKNSKGQTYWTTYKADGTTFSKSTRTDGPGFTYDSGQWRVEQDAICERYNNWGGGKEFCHAPK
jgi:hypothetical protein